MSIFKSTFAEHVKEQLKRRQDAIYGRTPQALQYINSRNAWIRMSSSVNVNNSNDLAKKYVLQGGTLNVDSQSTNLKNAKLKSGLGDFQTSAYSNIGNTPNNPYQRGIRPMPGITSAEIKSKSAYGSLREITVNFQCWDIQQLEDLEVLYMRPGYTVLVEWGWVPYIDNKGNYQSNFIDYYDIINKTPTSRTILFQELYKKSIDYSGNYDAMFGYIKNYQWSARPDGGYDCTTTIISTGELIESLKINYTPATAIQEPKDGKLNNEFTGFGSQSSYWLEKYGKYNTIAGIWAEAYFKIREAKQTGNLSYTNNSIFKDKAVSLYLPYAKGTNADTNLSYNSNDQVYITLECMFDVLNKYIIAFSPNGETLLELSAYSTEYDSDGKKDLYCIAHPLQVSVDPRVCLIKSPLWYDKAQNIVTDVKKVTEGNPDYEAAKKAFDDIKKGYKGESGFFGASYDRVSLIRGFSQIKNRNIYNFINGLIKTENEYENLQEVLNEKLKNADINLGNKLVEELNKVSINAKIFPQRDPNKIEKFELEPAIEINNESQTVIIQGAEKAISNLQFLKNLQQDYFYNNKYSEIGIIKNIYVNVDYLYQKAIDINLEAQDKKEKNEINLYNYIKTIIRDIQASIGNINNFEIHVDPVDNKIARVIDINYTEPEKAIYNKLFELQVHNLQSVVRSYSLQSQIFPEQSSIIAIGAQVKGGQLGMQTNTMIDFNKNITDRIIPEKLINDNISVNNNNTSINSLANIIKAFESLNYNTPVNNKENTPNFSSLFSNAKNSLRDVIAYFQSITQSPGSNRNLIPTKLSIDMDGIGGLVIGHMFRLPKNVLPKGYRGEKVGVQLGNAITSISHTISGGDWVTKIDSLNIVLQNDNNAIKFEDLNLNTILSAALNPATETLSPGFNNPNASNLEKYVTERNIATVKKNQLNSGGEIEQGIAAIAGSVLETIKQRYPDIKLEITGGNDVFHQNLQQFSNHQVGKAIDFTISPATNDNIKKVVSVLEEFNKMQPKFRYLNEYDTPTKHATGKHFHISFDVTTKGA